MTRHGSKQTVPQEPVLGKASFSTAVARSNAKAERDLIRATGLPIGKPTIRSTGIDTHHLCPRKHMLRNRCNLKPKAYRSATTIGTHTHRILGSLALGNSWSDSYRPAERKYEAEVTEMGKLANPVGLLPWGVSFDSVQARAYKDFGLGAALAWFVHKHDPIDFKKWEVVATERLIEIQWEGIKTPIRVRIDVLMRLIRTGEIFFVDYKTTSMNPLDRIALLTYEMQPKLYRVAVAAMLQDPEAFNLNTKSIPFCKPIEPGTKLAGVLHCIVGKPGIRVKKTETVDEYIERCETILVENQAAYEKGDSKVPSYARSLIKYTGPLVDEEFLFQLREHDLACKSHVSLSMFPRRSASCYNWNTPCEYLPLCQSPVSGWKRLLDTRYEVRSRDEEDILEHD